MDLACIYLVVRFFGGFPSARFTHFGFSFHPCADQKSWSAPDLLGTIVSREIAWAKEPPPTPSILRRPPNFSHVVEATHQLCPCPVLFPRPQHACFRPPGFLCFGPNIELGQPSERVFRCLHGGSCRFPLFLEILAATTTTTTPNCVFFLLGLFFTNL